MLTIYNNYQHCKKPPWAHIKFFDGRLRFRYLDNSNYYKNVQGLKTKKVMNRRRKLEKRQKNTFF